MDFHGIFHKSIQGIENLLDRRFYVYIHKIPKTDLVFHVGKGTGNRATNRTKRTDLWQALVDLYDGQFETEIISERLTEGEALMIENKLQTHFLFHGNPILEIFPDWQQASDTHPSIETAEEELQVIIEKALEIREDGENRKVQLLELWQMQFDHFHQYQGAFSSLILDQNLTFVDHEKASFFQNYLISLHDEIRLEFFEAYESWLLYLIPSQDFFETLLTLSKSMKEICRNTGFDGKDKYSKFLERDLKKVKMTLKKTYL